MKNLINKLQLRFRSPAKELDEPNNKYNQIYDLFTVKDFSITTIDQLKFVFAQAERRLEDSHKTYDATSSKTITLITITVAIFSTLVTYFFYKMIFTDALIQSFLQ